MSHTYWIFGTLIAQADDTFGFEGDDMKSISVLTVASAALLSACLQDVGPKEGIGAAVGAAIGGIAGAQVGDGTGQLVAVGAGVLLGALVGSEIGQSLDKADQLYAAQAYDEAIDISPTGTTTSWANPDSGNSGTYTPTQTYQTESGQYCREFQQTITVGGETQDAYGTACRQPDGTWQIANNQ